MILSSPVCQTCQIDLYRKITEQFRPELFHDSGKYLRKIRKFREDGYEILDETWVNQNHATDYICLPVDGSDAPEIPSGKVKRLIVLHAGNREEGLIDRCDLVFLAKAKDGDYHQEMNLSKLVRKSA